MAMIIALVFLMGSGYHAYMGNWNAAIWTAFMCSISLAFEGRIEDSKKDDET